MTSENQAPIPDNEEEPTSAEDHHYRMRFQWHDLMEDLIEDGRRRGLFDGLAGAGKPLDLDNHIYEGNNSLANQLMKANDIRPIWLSQRLAITEKIESFRATMERTWERYRATLAQSPGDSHRKALALGWDSVCKRWDEDISALNREIETYNLKRPPGQMEIFKLRLVDELQRIDAPRYLP